MCRRHGCLLDTFVKERRHKLSVRAEVIFTQPGDVGFASISRQRAFQVFIGVMLDVLSGILNKHTQRFALDLGAMPGHASKRPHDLFERGR